MAWSSSGYSYTEGEIGSTAYNAGCGSGYLWIHENPNMFIKGTISNDGSYDLTFYKPNDSRYGYNLRLSINDTNILNIEVRTYLGSDGKWHGTGDLDNTTYSKQMKGTVKGTEAVVKLFCSKSKCDSGADIYDGASNPVGKEIIRTTLYTAPSVGSLSVTSKTTKSITVKATWTEGSATSTATVNLGSQSGSISSSGSSCTFNNLTHNTAYTISGSLSDGTTTASYTSISSTTKKLGCTYDTTSAKQYSISAKFYATVDDTKNPTQSGISCSAAELQNSSGNKLKDLTTFSGTSGTISASELTSYTTYKLKCSITDGHNTVSNTVSLTTIFPYARIKVNGAWKKAIPYVNVNGHWKMAKPYVKNSSGTWKECNGED